MTRRRDDVVGHRLEHEQTKTDPDSRVLREDRSPIEGLYAIGDVSGSAECKDGSMYYNGLNQALGYGMVAAETIGSDP